MFPAPRQPAVKAALTAGPEKTEKSATRLRFGAIKRHGEKTAMKANTELELQSAPIDPSWILSGTPTARNRILFNSSDASGWTMLWDCTAGEFRWQYRVDEIIHFLEGSVTITDENGVTTTHGPGDVICLRAGTAATWRIESYVRKLAFCQHQLPAPVGLAMRLWRRAQKAARTLLAPGLDDAKASTTRREPAASACIDHSRLTNS
jgi:uncharacterized cupin superfamily protein